MTARGTRARRAALRALRLHPGAAARPAPACASQRHAAAARGRARRARLAARRGDHHGLAHRRRHDERVDPAGHADASRPDRRARVSPRPRRAAGAAAGAPARRRRACGRRARLRDHRRRRHLDRAARAVGAALAACRRRLRRRATLRRRPRRDGDLRLEPRARLRGRQQRSRAGAPCLAGEPDRGAHCRDPRPARGRPRSAAARHRRVLARRGAGGEQRARLARDARAAALTGRGSRAARLDGGGLEHAAASRPARHGPTRPSTRCAPPSQVSASTRRSFPSRSGCSRPRTRSGKSFTSMFTAMGSFGVLAGLLLLVNLFVMLAAERKTELGTVRAVGMRRVGARRRVRHGGLALRARRDGARRRRRHCARRRPRRALCSHLRHRAQPSSTCS